MKKLLRNKAPFAIFFSFAVIASALLLISQSAVKPQAQSLAEQSTLVPISDNTATVEVKNSDFSTALAKSTFAISVKQNLNYRNSISWAFGGKPQKGWYLYEPLVKELIKTEKDADTEDFAAALAAWQKSFGLNSTGIMDETVLAAIIKTWQSNRMKFAGEATLDKLVPVSASEFWDPARPYDLRMVERETYAAYQKMIRAAIADKTLNLKTDAAGNLAPEEKFLKIISAHRSRAHQQRLRAASPNSGSAGLAVNSPHFSGRALDIYVGGEPVTTRDDNRALQIQTPAYRWLVKNAAKFGFKPYFYEPWHWEYAPDEKR